MAEELEDVIPRKKKRGKISLSRKKIALIIAILLIFSFGALFQHFLIEPMISEGIASRYSMCLTQKKVLDERYVRCENDRIACEYQLQQCLGTS